MTDKESREAFEEWHREKAPFDGYGMWPSWQAAVEWAAKRERKRCAEIAISHYTGPDAAYEIDSEVGK